MQLRAKSISYSLNGESVTHTIEKEHTYVGAADGKTYTFENKPPCLVKAITVMAGTHSIFAILWHLDGSAELVTNVYAASLIVGEGGDLDETIS